MQRVTTIDNRVDLYQDRDLSSRVIAQIPTGQQLQLGEAAVFDGREWMEATLEDGTTGYCLGPNVRGHSTLIDAVVSSELPRVAINPRDRQGYVWIPPGTFLMGTPRLDNWSFEDEMPAHTVTITRGFWMAQTPVPWRTFKHITGMDPVWQRTFEEVRAKNRSSADGFPVRSVTWDEAKQYASIIGMRLPTEAEWEWAAREGKRGKGLPFYSGGLGPQAVARNEPNAYGLYDMLGNVFEWVADWYGPYEPTHQTDPRGPSNGQKRVLRGGPRNSSTRYMSAPDAREEAFSFRCVAAPGSAEAPLAALGGLQPGT